MKKVQFIFFRGLCLLLFLIWHTDAQSIPINGTLTIYYHQYSGTINPIDVQLENGNIENTGLITYYLDYTNPELQVMMFDFDKMKIESHIDVLVDNSLSIQQRLHLDYCADILEVIPNDLVPGEIQDLNIKTGPVSGYGIFGPNQPFAGWTYSNILMIVPLPLPGKPDDGGQVACAGPSSGWRSGEILGTLKSPDGLAVTSFNTTGYGFAALDCTPVPEPSSIALLLGGVILMQALTIFKRKRETGGNGKVLYPS
ncbi:MAG: PEP-CTERM sorting domain-containing protein [Desulfobacterales bacterium]|nr:PEP-CTERM sorting domain-containing protein [Desulfobacterales bacterium]